MTVRQIIEKNPQNSNESNEAYFRRLSELSNGLISVPALKSKYYRIKRKFVETQRKYDKNDNIISRTEKLQSTKLVLPPEHLELSRLSTNEATGQQWQIYTKESQNKALFELNKQTIKNSIESLNLTPLRYVKREDTTNDVLLVTYTDVHVGMDIKNDIYDCGKWDEIELNNTLMLIVDHVKKSYNDHSKIIIQDLGDFMDGWDKKTTRGGHNLPQNMTNEEAFKVGTKFKIDLAIQLAYLGCELEFHNIVNDNHSGSFSYIANYHVKQVLSYLLPEVKYNIHEQFINHYIVGKWCFIITHGKDKEFMKFGFKPQLDQKAKDHIINYIDKFNLHNYKISFCKGDSHQLIRDSSDPKFEYNSYLALSPSSEWVQVNFSKGRRGFSIEEIKGNLKSFISIEL